MTDKVRNLLVRAATGVVFVAVIIAATLFSPLSFAALLAVVAAGCAWEFWRLVKTPLERLAGIAYIVVALGLMLFISTPFAVVFVVTVWANDVFAYLTGMALGKHPMAPKISPKKTWEGFAGGILGAIAVAVCLGKFWIGGTARGLESNVLFWALFGLCVALTAVAGDLVESRIKRRAGVKDSGIVFPGHGGFLDRFDAMLGAAPVAFLFFLMSFFTIFGTK